MAVPETAKMADITKMADIVVVYGQHEHYVQVAVEPTTGINIDLLQCQILSLVGLVPEDQILATSRGDIIASPFLDASTASSSLPLFPEGQHERVFLINAAIAKNFGQRVPSDWREICTRCTFGDLPAVQQAFRVITSGDTDALVCGVCATTCSTDTAMVSPLDWRASKKLAARFISELLIVAGEPNVPAPPGFTKVPGDLNYSASGDFVHLFIKRGGPRAVTKVMVTHQPCNKKSKQESSMAAVQLPVDCNSGSASDVTVLLSYDSISARQAENLSTYAITDILLIVGESKTPGGYVKIPKNLNKGCLGSEAIYLGYKLAPLGGFVCTTQHGAFGECLFQSRHATGVPPHIAVPAGCSPPSDNALSSLSSARERVDSAFWQDHYRQHESGMRSRLLGGLERVKSYENPQVQAEARKRIPIETLHERARANPTPLPSYQDELVMQLTHWFKREFFTWMNQPPCAVCQCEKTQLVHTDPPSTPEETAGQAGRVEVYECSQCRALTRFPRYNDPVKLLDTRTGRCGEWANCFTLCCRAMGFEARYVLDVTDHVWTEVYSEHHKRWLHCDSCEDQLDRPLTYEVGWGKKLSYIFSFSFEQVVDTAQRYTQNWDDMQLRRSDVSEAWLASTIQQMNQSLRQPLSPERLRVLDERAIHERAELSQGRKATADEVQGRVSGSDEWKSQRHEDGNKGQDGGALNSPTTHQIRHGNDTLTGTVLMQTLVKQMLIGCDRGSECKNPNCLHKRLRVTSEVSPTDRAAQALQEVAALQTKNLSVHGLASMLCPRAGGIQEFVWSQDVVVYLPLQDSEMDGISNAVTDVSGNGHHGQSTGPLRKPFNIPAADGTMELAFGLQLLPGRNLSVPIPEMDRFMLSSLVRFDSPAFEHSSGGGTALSIDFGAESNGAFVCVRSDGAKDALIVEARSHDGTLSKSGAVVKPGSYYHISIVVDRRAGELTVSVNGKEAVRTHILGQATSSPVVLKSPAQSSESKSPSSTVPVISHVAVLADVDNQTIQRFNDAVKQRFVCWPPLQAYGASGTRTDKTCSQREATVQSGYRVCRVRLWGSEFFDGIQLVYEKPLDNGETAIVEGPLVGNRTAREAIHSPMIEVALLPHEYLARLSGRKGAWMDSILLETNFGRRFTCGGNGGDAFSIDPSVYFGHPVQIRSIQFDVGDHLVDPIAFVAEAPAAKDDASYSELRRLLENVDSPTQHGAIRAATRYLENIVATPEDPKFQKIRASNKFFSSSVGALATAEQTAFMKWCGFDGIVESDETFYVYQLPTPQGISKVAEASMRLHYLKTFVNKQ